MALLLKEFIKRVQSLAPEQFAEDWDKVGLMVGDEKQPVSKVLVALDVNEQVLEEAVEQGAELIFSHHPLIFKPVNSINEGATLGKLLRGLIRENIAVYSAHTNLDSASGGFGDILASRFGLKQVEVLRERRLYKYKKIVVYVPEGYEDSIREAMAKAGAGCIGNYSECSFMVSGTGTFRPGEGTNPFIGSMGKLEKTAEKSVEMVVPGELVDEAVAAMLKVHPYEEVAYDIFPMEIYNKCIGPGRVGYFEEPLSDRQLIEKIKEIFNTNAIKIAGCLPSVVESIAIFNGSFDSTVLSELKGRARVIITGDLKYHDAQEIINRGLCAIDVGHYESERTALEGFVTVLQKTVPEAQFILSQVDLNPFRFV